MKSFDLRNQDTFLRNAYYSIGTYNMPVVCRQKVNLESLQYLGFHNTKAKNAANHDKTVHFYLDDNKFERVWREPGRYIDRLKQYRQVLSPDFSIYTNMPLALQIYNTFRRRWCSAYWQSEGIKVIPAVAWAGPESYTFCFDGIEKGSVIAVSTVGCRKIKENYMAGFTEMCKRLEPQKVICYYQPFDEMKALCDIIMVEYEGIAARKEKATEGSGS